jgi:lysophospholipase L1-like esterase
LTLLLAPPIAAAAEPSPCDPERWKGEIAAFERQDQSAPPRQGGIVFVGSSSIRLWDLPKSYPKLPVVNRGFGGSELCDSVHFFDVLVTRHLPRVIVLYAGDNDIAAGKTAEQVYADFQAFVAKMKRALPEARLVYIAIKPSIQRWNLAPAMREANTLIAADCAADFRLAFVDVWKPMLGADGKPRPELFRDDGLHLNDEGYRLWTDLLRPHIATRSGAGAPTGTR